MQRPHSWTKLLIDPGVLNAILFHTLLCPHILPSTVGKQLPVTLYYAVAQFSPVVHGPCPLCWCHLHMYWLVLLLWGVDRAVWRSSIPFLPHHCKHLHRQDNRRQQEDETTPSCGGWCTERRGGIITTSQPRLRTARYSTPQNLHRKALHTLFSIS